MTPSELVILASRLIDYFPDDWRRFRLAVSTDEVYALRDFVAKLNEVWEDPKTFAGSVCGVKIVVEDHPDRKRNAPSTL